MIPNDEYCNTYTVAEVQSKREGGGAKLCEFPTNDKNDFLQTQRIKQLDKYSIRIKYSYLHSSTNRKLFHAFVYVL